MATALLAGRERGGARGAALACLSSLPARLEREAELSAHDGCVNHLCWSADGARLLTSGDDTRLVAWDVARRAPAAVLATGHTANVFCVRFLPGTADAQVATCAGDAQARARRARGAARRSSAG
jgi:WD40 repeat protein